MDDDWRLLGADPDQVRAQYDDEPGADETDDSADVELGPHEWRAWMVFLACINAWQVVGLGGMGGGVWYQCIAPSDVLAAAEMLHVKRKHWPIVLWMVQVMEREDAKYLNKPTDT